MEEQKYTEKTYSFYELLKEHKIEIPIIQRDYAQGREDKTEILDNFLSALFLSIHPGSSRLKLDFIYGSIVNKSFQPLDGQQRLSTLFLLHWYAALKDNELTPENKSLLSKFTYETRISSRDFCNALVNNDIEFQYESESLLSEKIIDSPWFFLSWKKDPTISAMLRTIDQINSKFYSVNDLWMQLCSTPCPIYFYFVQLENIGLTDDLYIKMNARGKLLSSFENFKAGLQKLAQSNDWKKETEPRNTFSFKIDTEWTDFFWANFRSNNSVDESLMNFISTIIMIRLACEKEIDDRVGWIKKLNDDPNNLRPLLVSKDTYEYLYIIFELYRCRLKDLKSVSLGFPWWRHVPAENFLNQVANNECIASYSQKILFFAQTEYMIRNQSIDTDKYNDWMRVVRNIVARANPDASGKRPDIIRSPETFDGAVSLVAELAEGSNDIYFYLSGDKKISSSFAKSQVEEEKLKSRLIKYDAEYKDIIHKLEDTELLMGRIDFALHCIPNYITGDMTTVDKANLQSISNVICKYFSKEKEIDPDIRRALLTIDHNGQYEYYNYWWSNWNVVDATKRCLINNFRELEYCIAHDECREYLKKLVMKLSSQTLQEIIENFNPPSNMPQWKVKLIKEPQWLNRKFSNFIAIPEDNNCCYLLKSKRPREIKGSIKVE